VSAYNQNMTDLSKPEMDPFYYKGNNRHWLEIKGDLNLGFVSRKIKLKINVEYNIADALSKDLEIPLTDARDLIVNDFLIEEVTWNGLSSRKLHLEQVEHFPKLKAVEE
tara:strand:+ start:640 stop:966 length:327 start_codon:yes stop_codon:yes gene_type:complete